MSDDAKLPTPGATLAIELLEDGTRVHLTIVVTEARPDFEPGWIQVAAVRDSE